MCQKCKRIVVIVTACVLAIIVSDAAKAGPIRDRIRERVAERRAADRKTPADPVLSLNVDGGERQFVLHLPETYSAGKGKLSLVLFFHGGRSNAEGMDRLSGFNAVADANGFIVVYPKGVDRRWNDGRGSEMATADDVGFVRALIGMMVRDYRVDSRRVYATGISNGAILLHRLALELPDMIAAIAPVAGTIPSEVARRAQPARPMPILIIHGTEDPLILWEGGTGEKRGQIGGATLSIPATIKFWAEAGGSTMPEVTRLDPLRDGTSVVKVTYGSNVILYKVVGGGHTWPGGWEYAPERIIGKTSRDFDATEVIWNFFRSRSR